MALSPKITALLGPTNTGKTHFAIERMLAHRSGMIGLPLRLLAREVYDRVARLKGANEVALVTGEEKIVPKAPRFWVCTVQAMPLDIRIACLVIDEIQLCNDPERGHVFTDRLLHARGEEETLFLGSESMRGLIQKFVPKTWFDTRPRFSDLAYAGARKLTRLPRRSAIVGFSAEDVYSIADIIRRQRGGAAVVLGALSPRTRNAQVALYQSGDVDFLVATDAIGMGLNMDVDHVAFAGREKFDGHRPRALRADEIGQIAGRAGRWKSDGTFGVTADCEQFEEELINRVESHRYEPVRVAQWRNAALDFTSVPRLIESLEAPAPEKGLARARAASDIIALKALAEDGEAMAPLTSRAEVARFWEVCQLPDFRKLSSDEHVKLVKNFAAFLASGGAIPNDWMGRQVARLDESLGDVATLSGRLAHIRTLTYVANRPGWTEDSAHWRSVTRAVEDRLSDALHESLTQRFIDRRTSILLKTLRDEDFAALTLDDSGAVAVGGESIGRLDGLSFVPDPRAKGIHGRTLRAAAFKGLEGEIARRTVRLLATEDRGITLSEHGKLWWDGAIVGMVTRGPSPLSPRVTLVADTPNPAVEAKLQSWLDGRLEVRLAPLLTLKRDAEGSSELSGMARGVAHQLAESFGVVSRKDLALPDRIGLIVKLLRPYGVWFGRREVWLPKLLRPDAAQLGALLWNVWNKSSPFHASPAPGLTSFPAERDAPRAFLRAAGFEVVAGRAIRLDMLERLQDELEKALTSGADAETLLTRIASFLGSSREEASAVLTKLGWKLVEVKDAAPVYRKQPLRRPRSAPPETKADPSSPFAQLAALKRR
ncbi:MAG: disulfide oxidoreductase [Alphaproteobacteria bacterium]|nr:disulfide oxidoreductase [Alphaproteobacteria bacterium]